MSISDNAVTYIIMRSPKDHTKQFHYAQRFIHFRDSSNIISLKFCLSWTPPLSHSVITFGSNPPPYLSLFITLIALRFDPFLCILLHFSIFYINLEYLE